MTCLRRVCPGTRPLSLVSRKNASSSDAEPGRQLGDRRVGQQPSPADHHQPVGGQRHLADQVAGDEHRAALGGQRPQQVADPADPLRDPGRSPARRAAARAGSPSSAAAMPSRCAMPSENFPARRPAALVQADHVEHLVDPGPRNRVAGGQRGQVTRGRYGPGGTPWPPAARRPRAAASAARGSGGRRSAPARRPGRSRPRISRIVVDLPDPFGPRKPVTAPGRTSKLSPSTATVGP